MKDVSITFRLRESEKEILAHLAAAKDVPVSQLIREAVKQYLKEKGEDGSTKSKDSFSK